MDSIVGAKSSFLDATGKQIQNTDIFVVTVIDDEYKWLMMVKRTDKNDIYKVMDTHFDKLYLFEVIENQNAYFF